MKIPALFTAEKITTARDQSAKKEFSSAVGARSSFFYEWNESSPVEVLFHAKKDSVMECVFLQNLPLDAEVPAQLRIIADRGAQVKCTIVHQGALKSQIILESNCAESGSKSKPYFIRNPVKNMRSPLIRSIRFHTPSVI